MVVVGEFEAEIIVDDAPLRELRDGTKTYVISKEGSDYFFKKMHLVTN